MDTAGEDMASTVGRVQREFTVTINVQQIQTDIISRHSSVIDVLPLGKVSV